MDHLAFYNVGCQPSPGSLGIKARVRRQLSRAFRPMFVRLVEILSSIVRRLDHDEHEIRELRAAINDLHRRQEEQAGKLPATIAFGWDYVAMVRRLAVLEEHVDALMLGQGSHRSRRSLSAN